MLIATTNNLHLVDGPLKDRFRCVMVEYPSTQQWIPRFVQVLTAEGIPITSAQALVLLHGFAGSGRSLDDWMEDYVLRLRDAMTKSNALMKPPLNKMMPQQPYGNNINGSGK